MKYPHLKTSKKTSSLQWAVSPFSRFFLFSTLWTCGCLPSLKLTFSHLKIDVWKMICPFGARPIFRCYCSWKKSCTSWCSRYPSIHRVLYIPGGEGFLNHQQYVSFFGCLNSLSSRPFFFAPHHRRHLLVTSPPSNSAWRHRRQIGKLAYAFNPCLKHTWLFCFWDIYAILPTWSLT